MRNRLSVAKEIIPPFFKELATQYRKRFFWQVLAWGCCGALVIVLFFLWTMKYLDLQLNYSFLLSALLAPLASCLIFILSPLPWQLILQEADRNLGLKGKLTTFAQYYYKDPDNPFLPFLESTLTAELGELSTKRIFPLRKTPFVLITACTVCLLGLVFLPGRSTSVLSPGEPTPEVPPMTVETPSLEKMAAAETNSVPKPPGSEETTQSPSLFAPDGTSMQNLPDLRSRLDNIQGQNARQLEPQSGPEEMGDPSSTESTRGTEPKQSQEDLEKAEEAANEERSGSNHLETPSGSTLSTAKPDGAEDYGGQNGFMGQNEIDPADDSPSSSGASRQSTTPFQEDLGGFEPVAEYNPLPTSSQVSNDSYLSSYLEKLYPPEPGLPPGEEQLRARLSRYSAQILAAYGSEEIPVAYRDLIRKYFSLLAEEAK